jgi:multisubunit Na+/H+ antiporter MnhE subunit
MMGLIFIGLFGLWIALTRSTDPYVLIAGIAVAAGVTLVQHHLFPTINLRHSSLLRRPHRIIAFLATLSLRFVTSTINTCGLILSGREEGRIVALPIRVEDPFAQFLLLNSITLTPSTISLLLEGDLLYIHWLREEGHRGDWRTIKESLEEKLLTAFEGGQDGDR